MIKVSICYPPLENAKGVPLLGQNRQFQWFNSPTYIYPMVPAYAASYLKAEGFRVSWDDFIAEEKTWQQFLDYVRDCDVDLMMLESKSPVIKLHWDIIRQIKELRPEMKLALVGDHVTVFPEESMEQCPVDFVLTGGNYDFLIMSVAKVLNAATESGSEPDYTKLEPGIWYREGEEVKNSGKFNLAHDLNDLPMIDRELTKWWLYAEKNGNYSRIPGTYTMAARDCWYHKCAFCSWTAMYNEYHMRSPEKLLDEIGMLIERYGVKEIMDDSGAFPVGEWLKTFCEGMIERGYNKKVIMDCNMRLSMLNLDEYKLMKQAGFRFVLFGLESANQETLDRLNKGEQIETMIESCKLAKQAGLSPHITLMFGYPWEGEEEVANSVRLGQELLKKGYAHTLQATICIPYPTTPLYRECKENGWLQTEEYEEYDMRRPIMKTPMGDEKIKEAVESVYKVAFNPEFLLRRVASIRSIDDVKFFTRAAGKVMGHLMDFSSKSKKEEC